jgi:hypothetical protein
MAGRYEGRIVSVLVLVGAGDHYAWSLNAQTK